MNKTIIVKRLITAFINIITPLVPVIHTIVDKVTEGSANVNLTLKLNPEGRSRRSIYRRDLERREKSIKEKPSFSDILDSFSNKYESDKKEVKKLTYKVPKIDIQNLIANNKCELINLPKKTIAKCPFKKKGIAMTLIFELPRTL